MCAVNTVNVRIISTPISKHAETACPEDKSGLPSADAGHICAAVHSSVHETKFFLRNERPAVPATAAWVGPAFISNFGACVSEAETFREFASRPLLWLHLLDQVGEGPCRPRYGPAAGAAGGASPSPPLTY